MINKLNNVNYACATCDKYDKCTLHNKNKSESVYCSEFALKYGCEWAYRKSMFDDEDFLLCVRSNTFINFDRQVDKTK